jgi:putative endonuclease
MTAHSNSYQHSAAARTARGAAAEERAAQLMQSAGFTIIARNFRCRAGELDIVARRGPLLVVAEVRLRSSARFGGAAASVSAAKRRRIVMATRFLLAQQPQLAALAVRFDVLACDGSGAALDWIEGAFAT